MRTVHTFKSNVRTGTVTVDELEDVVRVEVRFSAYGRHGDEQAFAAFMFPILCRYENDPRPVQMTHPLTGEVATIRKAGSLPYAVVKSPTKQ